MIINGKEINKRYNEETGEYYWDEFDVIWAHVGGDITRKDDIFTYNDGQTPMTEEELDAEMARIEEEFTVQEYQRDRASSYPKLGEQFDLLYHAIDDGALDKTSDFYTKLKKVKDDNPKPD